MTKRLLILGGTAEARLLAYHVLTKFRKTIVVITSLVGATQNPAKIMGSIRIGSFGGIEGLGQYLTENSIDFLIDATHPFANRISLNAAKACAATKTPRLMLQRPSWKPKAKDHWTKVNDLSMAASILPNLGQICFLTVGTRSIPSFSSISKMRFIVRLMEAPQKPLPLIHYEIVLDSPPYKANKDELLMQTKGVDILVTKNAGSNATYSKIIAARNLGIPVIMISRPVPPEGLYVTSIPEAINWLHNSVSNKSFFLTSN